LIIKNPFGEFKEEKEVKELLKSLK